MTTTVMTATQVTDLLEPFAAFRAYKRRGVEATISCSRPAELPAGVGDWAFRLCKANMQVSSSEFQCLLMRMMRL